MRFDLANYVILNLHDWSAEIKIPKKTNAHKMLQ